MYQALTDDRWVSNPFLQATGSVGCRNVTKSQVNKLGERLRADGPPSEELLRQLQSYRTCFEAPMLAALARLGDLGEKATARIKTVNTIIEKLRREKMRLSVMQDIAGLRIVKKMDRSEQDALVKQIAKQFPGCTIIDRRARPSHGYRAVHIVAAVDGYAVEVQVRTHIQDSWAQSMEKVADVAGRGIRYGEVPDKARDIVDTLLGMSDALAVYETVSLEGRAVEMELDELRSDREALDAELSEANGLADDDARVVALELKTQALAAVTERLRRKSKAHHAKLGMAVESVEALLKRLSEGNASQETSK